MARLVEYVLSRYGEDLLIGCAEEIAAAIGCSRDSVYRRAASGSVDSRGYTVERATPLKPPKLPPIETVCPPDDPKRPWNPSESRILAAMRRRREGETQEPRWVP